MTSDLKSVQINTVHYTYEFRPIVRYIRFPAIMTKSSFSELLAEIEALAANPPKELLDNSELRIKLYNACGAARSAFERPTEVVVQVLLSRVG